MEFLVDPFTHVTFTQKHKRLEKMTMFQAVGIFIKQKMKAIFYIRMDAR